MNNREAFALGCFFQGEAQINQLVIKCHSHFKQMFQLVMEGRLVCGRLSAYGHRNTSGVWMAIYKKQLIEKRLAELEAHYLALREALQGKVPGGSGAIVYRVSDDVFRERYVNVDISEVLLRLEHFKAEFTAIRALKTKAEKPVKGYN